ncbi:anti-sigma factor [Luteimonas pelagia]
MSEHDALAHDPPDDDLLAAEHVLGLHDARQRREVEARVAADAGFASRVATWEARFATLFAFIAPVDPPADLWPRLRRRLGWAAFDDARATRQVRFWRGATAGALAIAAALAVVAILRPDAVPTAPDAVPPPVVEVPTVPPPEAEVPKPVVVLAREDGATAWLAAVDAADGAVTMTPVPDATDRGGLVGELWLIPEGAAPMSLGFVSHEMSHTIDVPDAMQDALAVGATLAVTLEPEAGMPHAAPTGPVVAAGRIDAI